MFDERTQVPLSLTVLITLPSCTNLLFQVTVLNDSWLDTDSDGRARGALSFAVAAVHYGYLRA